MSATDWGHLPNAVLIDWVISTLKTHPQDWGAARDAARDAARGACLVFVAYDDCADFLNFGQHTLQASYRLTDHPAFLLLQPAAIVWKQHGLKP